MHDRPIILWVSRHTPLPAQRDELTRLYPGCEIRQDVRPFGDAADIMRRIETAKPVETVIVAPWRVMSVLCQRGLRSLWAEMARVDVLTDPAREVEAAGRVYRFVEFRRVVRVEMVTEPLE